MVAVGIGEGVVRKFRISMYTCCREEANSDSMLETVSLTCFSVVLVIIIILNGLPGGLCPSA